MISCSRVIRRIHEVIWSGGVHSKSHVAKKTLTNIISQHSQLSGRIVPSLNTRALVSNADGSKIVHTVFSAVKTRSTSLSVLVMVSWLYGDVARTNSLQLSSKKTARKQMSWKPHRYSDESTDVVQRVGSSRPQAQWCHSHWENSL